MAERRSVSCCASPVPHAVRILAFFALAACKQAPDTCANVTVSTEDPNLQTVALAECGDKKVRAVTCVPSFDTGTRKKSLLCTCSLDGVAGQSFNQTEPLSSDPMSVVSHVKAACAWP